MRSGCSLAERHLWVNMIYDEETGTSLLAYVTSKHSSLLLYLLSTGDINSFVVVHQALMSTICLFKSAGLNGLHVFTCG